MGRSLRSILNGDSSIGWLQPLPRTPPVNRREIVLAAARDKRVIHLGFTDEHVSAQKRADGRWLHGALASVTSDLVGLDLDEAGVAEAASEGYEAYPVDLQDAGSVLALQLVPADLVVAGEIIEHLDSPGQFLRAVKPLLKPTGSLIVTTPNAYRTLNFLAPILGEEANHPDHVGNHSIHTLRTLSERAGYQVLEIGYYQNEPKIVINSIASLVVKIVRAMQTRLLRRWPHWSDGIYAVLRL
jgi:SAM-dependent methyltransferase